MPQGVTGKDPTIAQYLLWFSLYCGVLQYKAI